MNREKKIQQYIKKLEKVGKKLTDITDKTIKQLSNARAFEKFEKQVKRTLERDKIIEQNKKYDEKIKEKRDKENEKIFRMYPWVKQVMKFDEKYKNVKDAKTVYNRKMTEERNELTGIINKYFKDKKGKEHKDLMKSIKNTKDIEVIRTFVEKVEYIIQAYGSEDSGINEDSPWSFELAEDEVLERIHSYFILEQINFNNYGKG